MIGKKITWLDLGMSQPLTLGMANHPLADRLETLASTNVNKVAGRSATVALLLGATLFAAPLTIAEAQPKSDLPDTVVSVDKTGKSKSVIKVSKAGKNGNDIKKHYEIEVNGGEVEAYEIDVAGRRTKINANEIDGFDSEVMQNSDSWAFVVDDALDLAFDKDGASTHRDRAMKHREKSRIIRLERDSERSAHHKERLMERGLSEERAEEIEKRIEEALNSHGLDGEGHDNKVRTFTWNSNGPTPPMPPRAMFLGEGDVDVDVETFVLDNLGEGEEHSNHIVIKKKGLNGEGNVISFGDGSVHHKLHRSDTRLLAAQSMLDSVEQMLGDMDDLEGEEKSLREAKRDLEKARRSLEKASKKIKKSRGVYSGEE